MRYEYNMTRIAKRYFLTYFIFDILTCLPTLLTLNNKPHLYYFKMLRFLQLPRVYAWFLLVKRLIARRFYQYFVALENITSIVEQATEFYMIFHVLTCIWIRLAIYNEDSWIYSKFDTKGIFMDAIQNGFKDINTAGEEYEDAIVLVISEIYYDAYYFMSTTMS